MSGDSKSSDLVDCARSAHMKPHAMSYNIITHKIFSTTYLTEILMILIFNKTNTKQKSNLHVHAIDSSP